MDLANGGLERFVRDIDSGLTGDTILLKFFEDFVEEGTGVRNRAVNMLSKKLANYGKADLRDLMKQALTDGDECKEQYTIVKELLETYRIISLEESKQLMVYDENHYTVKIQAIEKFISGRAEQMDVDQRKMFDEVYTWLHSNLQFKMADLCWNQNYIPFLNGYYDIKRDIVVDKVEDHEDWMFFYCLPHEYTMHPRGETWTANSTPKCNLFRRALSQWIDAKPYKENPITHKINIRIPYYRKGKRKILMNDIFEMIGLCMSLNVGFKKAFINYGVKDTGKTQLANIVGHIIGEKNLEVQELYLLTERFGSTAIQFKLLNFCGDMSNTAIKKTGMFNLYTGADKHIPAEIKGGKKFKFPPSCKFWFNINLFPYVQDFNNDAFFERFILIPFPNVFTNEQKTFETDYYNRIINDSNEIQGIIYESLRGLQRLVKRKGFRKEIEENTKHIWNYHSNPYYKFLEDFCELDKNGRIQVHEFFDRFSDEEGGGYTMFQLNRGLEKLGVRKREVKVPVPNNPKKRVSKYYYFGVKWMDNYTSEEYIDPSIVDILKKPESKQGKLDKAIEEAKAVIHKKKEPEVISEDEYRSKYGDIPDEF